MVITREFLKVQWTVPQPLKNQNRFQHKYHLLNVGICILQCGKGECRLFYAMNSTLKSLHSPLPHCSIGILDFTFFEKILDVYENSKSQNTGFL